MLVSPLLSQLFDDHLRIQRQRTDAAMAACKVDTLAIHAGSPHMLFLDDHPYPFKPNPHFKLWVPLEDAIDCWLVYRPGEKPRLIFLQPADYWHKPPSLPHGFWTHHFQIEVHPRAWRCAPPSHPSRPLRVHRRMAGAVQGLGLRARAIPEDAAAPACTIREPSRLTYELECMRHASHAAARGHVAAEAAFRAGKSEYEIHMAYVRATGHSERELPYSNIVALNTNAARPALPTPGARGAGEALLVPDRRGRAVSHSTLPTSRAPMPPATATSLR